MGSNMAPSRFAARCALLFALAASVNAEKLRMCVQEEDATEGTCKTLDRDESPVICERVVDSSNCAIDLAEGRADFGVFTADELTLTHHFYPRGLQVLAQLKNRDKQFDNFEFESVVVVPRSYEAPASGAFGQLVGAGLCHPGFSESQSWNDRVLKYFEQRVMDNVCRNGTTVAENELTNLKEFFGEACRPGRWVPDEQLDADLKKQHPELCELCDGQCEYSKSSDSHGHFGALDCLTTGRGRVAYVSRQRLKDYFKLSNKKMSDYRLLCEDGTTMQLDSASACTWFKQPWKVILARDERANDVLRSLEQLAKPSSTTSLSWQASLSKVLLRDSQLASVYRNETSIAHYLRAGERQDDWASTGRRCGRPIGWCCVGPAETAKCNWTAAAALSLGLAPAIGCVQARDGFDCFERIGRGQATVASIDSTYGYLARKAYGLSAVLFAESLESQYSMVVAAIREQSRQNRLSSWRALRGRAACFPEYAGIAWLSFVEVAREQRLLPANSCDYPEILAQLLAAACAPGFSEASHFRDGLGPRTRSAQGDLKTLCSLCPSQDNGEHCEASTLNRYFGDRGSLECLRSGDGDIAFFEARNLQASVDDGSVNASEFRVLCRNGSLALRTGFDVEQACALSVTIDSEVVSRRDLPTQLQLDTRCALLSIENWLGYRERRMLLVYGPFNRTRNLLFKDSTLALVPSSSGNRAVQAYQRLFSHVDACSSAAECALAAVPLLLCCAALLLLLPSLTFLSRPASSCTFPQLRPIQIFFHVFPLEVVTEKRPFQP